MATQSQKNSQDIIKLQGEIKLINNKIDTIRDNHLHHIDYKINNIYKVLWVVFGVSMSGLVNLVITLISK
jgi:hypothetical protein